jgi:hypothetical protein
MLYLVACLSMLIDHIGMVFFPDMIFFRFLGRIAFPLFAVGVGLGASRTKNIDSYLIRVFFLAVVSQVPFHFVTGSDKLNVLFSLGAGLLIYRVFFGPGDRLPWYFSFVLPLVLVFNVEYGLYGVLFVASCCFAYRFGFPFHFIFAFFVCSGFKSASFFYAVPFYFALVLSWYLPFCSVRLPRWFKYSFYPLQWLAFSIFLSFGHFFS